MKIVLIRGKCVLPGNATANASCHYLQVPSPYCPQVTGETCVSNFDKLWTDRTPVDSPCSTPVMSPLADSANAAQDEFHGFTYVAPSFLDGYAPMASSGTGRH